MSSASSSPAEVLSGLAAKHQVDPYGDQFAQVLDQLDPLRHFRQRFDYPKKGELPTAKVDNNEAEAKEDCLYLCGFGLGLKPKDVDIHVKAQLDKWRQWGTGTYRFEPIPTHYCDHYGRKEMGRLVGADPKCVAIMNGLTVNIHLLLVSFYQPDEKRYKILIEENAFPSDRYAVKSHIAMRGVDPEKAMLEIGPRPGEHTIRTDDILQIIEREGDSISVVFLSGVHYYTGQKFDMEAITKAGHVRGAYVGWDLAHAIANVEIRLDDWGVDFACWCSNKYLNGGPGGIGGAYLNGNHNNRQEVQLLGWWGNKESTKFEMRQEIDKAEGIDGFRIATPSPILIAVLKAGLEILDEAGMDEILKKQFLMTGYMEMLIDKEFGVKEGSTTPMVTIITPRDPTQRGSHLSFIFSIPLQEVHAQLEARGVVCDIRPPSVMRVSPVPLYNSFSDVYNFVYTLREVIDQCKK